jgi:hypothetical protein
MSHRQKQHLGRSAGDDRELPGRDVEGPTRVRGETIARMEEARDVSRAIDENEGWEPRRGGRARRRKQPGSHGKKNHGKSNR